MLVTDGTNLYNDKPVEKSNRIDRDQWSKDDLSNLDDFLFNSLSRNEGYISRQEAGMLKYKRVAIPGLGGVGGIHLINLVRSGICRFNISDYDHFEAANSNRQYGAKASNYNKKKLSCMTKEAYDINPYLQINSFSRGIDESNAEEFLKDVDLIIDGLDVFAVDIRLKLFDLAHQKKIPIITAAPLGFGSSVVAFSSKNKMSFRNYTDIDESMTKEQKLLHLVASVAPDGFHRKYLDLSSVQIDRNKVPSLGIGCQMASVLASSVALKILLNRKGVKYAPHYYSVDPYLGIQKKSRLHFGNKNPIQKIKLKVMQYIVKKNKLFKDEKPSITLANQEEAISRAEVEYMIKAGIQAPSGENRQPWAFKYDDDSIVVSLDKKADQSFFNLDQKAALVSLGAVVENIKIAATSLNIKTTIGPRFEDDDEISIHLKRDQVEKDILHEYIWERHVNRKKYSKEPLQRDVVENIKSVFDDYPSVQLGVLEGKDELVRLRKISEKFAKIRTNMKEIHEFFFSNIHFDIKDALKHRTGFPLDNLEAGGLGKLVLKKIKSWRMYQKFNKFGLGHIMSKKAEENFKHSSACLLLSIDDFSNKSYIEGGQALQRLWLELTKLGLSVQPMTTINFFHYRCQKEDLGAFDEKYHDDLKNGFEAFSDLFPEYDSKKNGQVMLLRIGYSEKIKTWTLRKNIEDFGTNGTEQ